MHGPMIFKRKRFILGCATEKRVIGPLSIRLIVEIRVALIMFYTPQLFVKKYYLKNE